MKTQMRPNWRRNLITEGEDGNETEDNEEEDDEDDDALGPCYDFEGSVTNPKQSFR